jgi:hypothetical protein
MKEWKMGDSSDFEIGQIVCALFAEPSLIKIAVLFGVLRATVSKVMSV